MSCSVRTVCLCCFVYVYLFLFVLSVLVLGLPSPSDNSLAVNNNNNNNNNNLRADCHEIWKTRSPGDFVPRTGTDWPFYLFYIHHFNLYLSIHNNTH